MSRFLSCIICCFVMMLFVTQPAFSEDGPQAEVQAVQDDPEIQKLNTALADITKDLDKAQRRHFYMIYNNHNLISTVKHVRKDVSDAIDACSEKNPDMKDDLSKRFDEWKAAVNEQMEAAEGARDNMIIAQDYASEKDIRGVMKQADSLRDELQGKRARAPVTSKEACEYLLNKMDETQTNMLSLLNATLVSLPQRMQEMDDPESEE